ncbi:MAG: lysine biosynthesis protein LysX [Phycisphaerae bacterium]|nr:lysine biosynthesis protein LysX [Phycisphaerae bacterium]MBM92562.1 lysine biosynthesis protein LysX [Phycisphaerae bacterium]HCT46480.1 lysine biosynthesis protein LysX [Phycisphaerales bacterium]
MRIAMTYTRLRVEERMLIDAFVDLGVDVTPIDLRHVIFNPTQLGEWAQYDAVFDRSLSLTNTLTSVRILESLGVRCINPLHAIEACSDKLTTTLAMLRAGVPTPEVRVAVDTESGLQGIEQLGYPCVIKPTVGSWGRLVSRVNDRDAAEAILEHREVLGSAGHHVVYAQEHIDKPERDIRVFVVGGRAIAAIERRSEHWLTNTARGAVAAGLEVSDELADLSQRAVHAVGADIAAVDLLECPRQGLLVNEINHSMEFRNSTTTTGVEIHRLVAEHTVDIATNHASQPQPIGGYIQPADRGCGAPAERESEREVGSVGASLRGDVLT